MIAMQYIVLTAGLILVIIGAIVLFLQEKSSSKSTKVPKGHNDGSNEIFEDRSNNSHDNQDYKKNVRARGGAVVMIGPIPIVVGSDPKVSLLMMIIAFAIMIFWFIAIRTI